MIKIKTLTHTALMCAFIAITSQITVPMPWGVPFTLQVFSVALAGFMFEPLQAVLSVVAYILLGAIGAPVFSGFRGGVGELISPTGGFIFGFLFLTLFCALSLKTKSAFCKYMCYVAGLCLCYIIGCAQFAFVSGNTFFTAFVCTCLPYIVKDIVCIASAYALSVRIKRALKSKS